MSVAKRVTQLREAYGESLRQAALRTGVSHTTIARMEANQMTTHYNGTMKKIADGYGVSVEWLLTGLDSSQDESAQIRSQALAAGVGQYIRVIELAAADGMEPGVLEPMVRLVMKASRGGLRLETVELAVDLLLSASPGSRK